MSAVLDVRPSPIAGTWYPGDPARLADAIDQYLESSTQTQQIGQIIGLVVPHAGHRYSGHVAAEAFENIRGADPEIVAVVSPLHHPASGQVLLSAHQAYETPLGQIPVATDLQDQLSDELSSELGITVQRIRNDSEHSLEIELPFLQRVLSPTFHLLPIMIRDQSRQPVEGVGRTLGKILSDRSVVLVASSDLSHFYPLSIAKKLDAEVLTRLESFDPTSVLNVETDGAGFACGRGAIAAVLWASKALGADAVKVLKHATSGDVTSDFDSVVGYGSALIYRSRDV
jgi:AmmeMemoRadiSam system protein B